MIEHFEAECAHCVSKLDACHISTMTRAYSSSLAHTQHLKKRFQVENGLTMNTTYHQADTAPPISMQRMLYSGVLLTTISTLFLMRDLAGEPFGLQMLIVLMFPALFYGLGMLVYRYLDAPLAAPGIVGTGAWLVVVGLIHLFEQRYLLPEAIQSYYWGTAAMLTAVLITATGHRIRIWFMLPLVPLVQINAMWALMYTAGINLVWWAALSFGLVLVWWEMPHPNERWRNTYRTSALLLSGFLLYISLWLPVDTQLTWLSAWGAAAFVVTIIALRHGATQLGPLVLVMLVAASLLGTPPTWFPMIWLVIAAVAILFSERDVVQPIRDMTIALAVLLSGAAAGAVKVLPLIYGIPIHPAGGIGVLFGAGLLLGWLGFRRGIVVSAHISLWLIAGGWSELYFIGLGDTNSFGLWLTFLPAIALLVERIITSGQRVKAKGDAKVIDTMTRLPLADLIIGLSAIILLWTALNISDIHPVTSSITLLLVVGIWTMTGLVYRLAVFIHLALWVAPIPYALLLWQTVPFARSLPMTGVLWQLLGLVFVLMGHLLRKPRPSIVAPFFMVGYVLLGFGMTFTQGDLFLVSLGLAMVVSVLTSASVLADQHPVWTAIISRLISPEQRPYAFDNVHNAFTLLSAWLSGIWIYLMLEQTLLSFSQRGLVLVLLSAVWIMLGRLLPAVRPVVGWHIYSAGWFLWCTGLVQIFFSPAEAVITAVLGLAISGEALHRSRGARYWLPVMVLQIAFSAMQAAYLLSLSPSGVLMFVLTGVSAVGIWFDDRQFGRITAGSAALFAVIVWRLYPENLIGALCMFMLALLAAWRYRQWWWAFPVYLPLGTIAFQLEWTITPQNLLTIGCLHLLLGGVLLQTQRPQRTRRLNETWFNQLDSATPFLWIGTALVVDNGFWLVFRHPSLLDTYLLVLTGLFAMGALVLGIRELSGWSLTSLGAVFLVSAAHSAEMGTNFETIHNSLVGLATTAVVGGLVIRTASMTAVRKRYPFKRMRRWVWWLRPSFKLANFLVAMTYPLMITSLAYVGEINHLTFVVLGGLVTLYTALCFSNTRHVYWMLLTVLSGSAVWGMGLAMLGWFEPHLFALPAALLFLLGAQWIRHGDGKLLEIMGSIIPLFLAALHVLNAFSTSGSLRFAYAGGLIVLLAGYGVLVGRRIPFTLAAGAIVLGALVYGVRVNVWLVVLVGGVGLMGSALLIEVQRERIDDWLQRANTVWGTWR